MGDKLDSKTVDYKPTTSNLDNFETSTNDYRPTKQTKKLSEISTQDIVGNITTCSNTTINLLNSGTIYSVNYAFAFTDCKWLLKSNESTRLRLRISMYNSYNHNHYIMLYNSSTIKNETLFAVLKGKEQSLELILHSEVL